MSMVELVRSWLLGVTGVAIFTAMAQGLMPEGSIKQVGKLTGGLILLIAALTPILSLDLDSLLAASQWEESQNELVENLDTTVKNQWEGLIVAELEAYIVDKAADQGISCTATVTCRLQDEIYLPDTVVIALSEDLTEEQQQELSRLIEEDFSISDSKISFDTVDLIDVITEEGVE